MYIEVCMNIVHVYKVFFNQGSFNYQQQKIYE